MKISVLTPSLNSVRFIERAILSVLKQTYGNWEHIIMDGGSTDGTVEIMKKYDHLIWESAPDRGQSDAMNKAFARSSGDVILYLNADDELADGAFTRFVEEFSKRPAADMIVGNLVINDCGKIRIQNPSISLRIILNYDNYKFPLNPVSYVYKATLQRKIGSFPIHNHFTMDYWFLLRAFLFGKVMKVEKPFGTFYFDGRNKSADGERGRKHLKIVRNRFIQTYFFRQEVFRYVVKVLVLRQVKRYLSFKVLIITP